MDVVRKNIEEAGGMIRTETRAGQGTTFILSLPSSVTTQIIQGFIVRSGSERCIIPLDTVSSSLSLNTADITTVQGKSSVLRFEDRLIPVQNLRSVVDSIPSNMVDFGDDSGIIIVTHVGNTEKAYVVDVVEGIRQVVVKPIQRVGTGQMDFISGGAIMGDGTVALILDMEKIMMR
jgi:two-component system chemotaxis sensor kinase CheA